jgi:hypothetical protein
MAANWAVRRRAIAQGRPVPFQVDVCFFGRLDHRLVPMNEADAGAEWATFGLGAYPAHVVALRCRGCDRVQFDFIRSDGRSCAVVADPPNCFDQGWIAGLYLRFFSRSRPRNLQVS